MLFTIVWIIRICKSNSSITVSKNLIEFYLIICLNALKKTVFSIENLFHSFFLTHNLRKHQFIAFLVNISATGWSTAYQQRTRYQKHPAATRCDFIERRTLSKTNSCRTNAYIGHKFIFRIVIESHNECAQRSRQNTFFSTHIE